MRGGCNFIDLSGKKFGRILAIKIYSKEKFGVYWWCECECGKKKKISGAHLRSGKTLSCGCLNAEKSSKKFKKHGHSLTGSTQTKEYKSWLDMKSRCTNPNNSQYHDYGGRGIIICNRWINSFENFLFDMGEKPTKNHMIERCNNEYGYFPKNCKWATRTQQNRNTRANHFIEYNGKRLSMAEWAENLGINYSTLRSRISRGWNTKRAFDV